MWKAGGQRQESTSCSRKLIFQNKCPLHHVFYLVKFQIKMETLGSYYLTLLYYRINWTFPVRWLKLLPVRCRAAVKTGKVIALLWGSSWKFNINVFSFPSLYSSGAPVRNCLAGPATQLNTNSNLLWVALNPLLLPLCARLNPCGLILVF